MPLRSHTLTFYPREPALIKITEGDDPEAVMKCLREWKNKFKA